MSQATDIPEFARHLVNLASPRLGGEALETSDDFFAPKERLLQDSEPVFIADKFDNHGKWMDGWESRRRRGGGHCPLSCRRRGRALCALREVIQSFCLQ